MFYVIVNWDLVLKNRTQDYVSCYWYFWPIMEIRTLSEPYKIILSAYFITLLCEVSHCNEEIIKFTTNLNTRKSWISKDLHPQTRKNQGLIEKRSTFSTF